MLGAMLRTPLRAITARVGADLAAAGYDDLRPAHFVVFQNLPAEGANATTLAERAEITKQSMGYLLDHLERHGYIERVPDPTDQRARIVRRTARGWAVEWAARASIQRLEDEWSAHLGEERMQQFRAVLVDLGVLLNV
jgi:DNA-binding MarR family transcriptional regulator